MEKARSNPADNALIYGKFLYQAGSWDYPWWVVFKIKKPYDHMIHMYTCIATNLDSAPKMLLNFYCRQDKMENYSKESKTASIFYRQNLLQTVQRKLSASPLFCIHDSQL